MRVDAMIGRETRMLLRHYLTQGASKSALARRLGIHRDTFTGGSAPTILIAISTPTG
jgi:hypothetical protein